MDAQQIGLQDYIENLNKDKNIKFISSAIYWNERGVNTPEEFEKYLLVCKIQELQKEIYGSCRPMEIFKDLPFDNLNCRVIQLTARLKEIEYSNRNY